MVYIGKKKRGEYWTYGHGKFVDLPIKKGDVP